MLVNNTKTTIKAFEANEIKVAQQLQVKGGNGDATGKPLPIIGDEDVVQI